LIFIVIATVLALVPLFSNVKWLTVLGFANFFAIFTMSWDILSGYTGQISFGHAFLVGAAAYASALINVYLDFPIWLTIPLGVLAAVILGLVVAVPALRLRGPYFALVTLILPIVANKLVTIFSWITGGEKGTSALFHVGTVDPLVQFPFEALAAGKLSLQQANFIYERTKYYYALGLMLLIALGLLIIARSKIGKIFEGIREDEEVVEAAGINTAKFKILAFIISSTVAGLGGAFYVHYWENLYPTTVLSLTLSIEMIIAAVVGGMGTIIGPIVGSYFLRAGQEYIKGLSEGGSIFSFLRGWDMLTFLVLLILLVFFARRGLIPVVYTLARRITPFIRV